MDRIIDRADLLDQLDSALAEVSAGGTVTITSAGSPLAKIVPSRAPSQEDIEEDRRRRRAALVRMIENAEKRGPITTGPWTRDDLYERVPWPDGPPCP